MKRKIKIGKRNYRIVITPVIQKNKNILGDIHYKSKTIHIKNNVSRLEQERTLYHEIVHGLIFDAARKLGTIEYKTKEAQREKMSLLKALLKIKGSEGLDRKSVV